MNKEFKAAGMPSSPDISLDMAFDKGLKMAFPPVMVHLLQALLEPSPSFSSIAGYLKMDPMLAGKILHIVNSASYGFTNKLVDLQRAAIAIGTSDLFKLVISLSLQKRLYPTSKREPELVYGDWRLTLWSALSAEAIADHFCPAQKREAYLAGMLKDIPLFLAFCRDGLPPFLQKPTLATMSSPVQFAEELQVWGRTHAEITHDIFLYWGLPEGLAQAASFHHDYDDVATHSPLTKSVIYATKWAELLHVPDADPGQLVAFELSLAAELNFDLAAMESFRSACAEKFNRLLSQLGIQSARPETRLHDQSLASIQSYYFLALGALGDFSPHSSRTLAASLQQQLRLFWGITSWELSVQMPGAEYKSFYVCNDNLLESSNPISATSFSSDGTMVQMPITCGSIEYGVLSIPRQKDDDNTGSTLPMFMHILGMCLDEFRRRSSDIALSTGISTMPFNVARLDDSDKIQDASAVFLDTFGLSEVPRGYDVKELVHEHLGISPGRFDIVAGTGQLGRGNIFSAPEGYFPGTPIYISRCQSSIQPSESYVLLGDVAPVSSLQSLVLAHPEVLDALFKNISENICLLDANGIVLWADSKSTALAGQNIFLLTKPGPSGRDVWDSRFLAKLEEPVKIRASLMHNGSPANHDLHFFPLGTSGMRQYLLVLSRATKEAATGSLQPAAKAKQRDPLTGLYGYTQFHALLPHIAELARKQHSKTGILFCDIYSLRGINHKYGYQKGDMILNRVAQSISASCRPGRDYPCRYGSDKFAVIATQATEMLMNSMAHSIHTRVNLETEKMATVNLGLALIDPGQPPKQILDRARKAAQLASKAETHICWAEEDV